jgi:hypothetical protein
MIKALSRNTTAMALAVLLGAACVQSPIRLVEGPAGLTGEVSALIAFSVDSAEPFALRGLTLVAAADSGASIRPGDVPIHPDEGNGQLFLYEVPAEAIRFGVLRFKYGQDWWETVGQGPAIPALPGTLTYLGRIQLHSVQVARYADTGRTYPAGARIAVTDAGDEDLVRLAARYPIAADLPLRRASPATWSDFDVVALRFVPRPGGEGGDARFSTFEPTDLPRQPPQGADQP